LSFTDKIVMNWQDLTITGYSTALFSTWFFVEELGLLFDAGEGITTTLLQKSRKIKQVFVSHADRDHLMGLFQLNQLNARSGFPIVHYPANCGSFPAIAQFVKKFDPHVQGTIWKPIIADEKITIAKDLYVQSIRNNHVQAAPGVHKSLSYKVVKTKRKLKPAFANLDPTTLKSVIKKNGRAFISTEIATTILGFSGDTPVEDYERWDQTKVLIHEATFLEAVKDSKRNRNKHSTLEEVFEMVANINLEVLILSHFSSRYSAAEIDAKICSLSKKYQLKIPIYRILPGISSVNVLKSSPINS
ncbi:MAG: MBL fold metallo-hydrolase, partial [Saprospiraceae bacterium]